MGTNGEMWGKMGKGGDHLPLEPATPDVPLSSKKLWETPAHVRGSQSSYVPSSLTGTAPASKVPSHYRRFS